MVSTKQTIILSLLLLSTMILMATAQALPGACIDYTTVQTTACGFTVDSGQGQGAIELCEDCYPCGVADGVCPNDFDADCSGCGDPDCMITITGYVEGLAKERIENVIITAELDHFNIKPTTTTNGLGIFSLQVPIAEFELYIQTSTYGNRLINFPTTKIIYENLAREDIIDLENITLEQKTCFSDCTSNIAENSRRCDPSCDGINGCNFKVGTYTDIDYEFSTKYNFSDTCNLKTDDFPVTFKEFMYDDQWYKLEGFCCNKDELLNITKAYKTNTNISIATNIFQKTVPITLNNHQGNTICKGCKFHQMFYSTQ